MLSDRYKDDAASLVPLNNLQQAIRDQILEKLSSQHYRMEKVQCCICHHLDFHSLAEKDRYGLPLSVAICKQCGLVQANPRMNEAAYLEFYEEEYRKLYGGTEFPTDAFFQLQRDQGQRIFSTLRRVLKGKLPQAGSRVCEIGCGAGGILSVFQEKGYEVVGFDLAGDYIEYGRKKYGLRLKKESLSSHRGGPYKLIILSHVLEHMLHPVNELCHISPMLADDGFLYVETPSCRLHANIDSYYQLDLLRLLQNAHVYYFTRRTLGNLLRACGYRLEYGNEFIQSVFCKGQDKGLQSMVRSDFPAIFRYLKIVESLRPMLPVKFIAGIAGRIAAVRRSLSG